MGACASGELESRLNTFYQPVGHTELRTAANQAASKRIRHLARGEWWKLSGRQELDNRQAGQEPAMLLASWPESLLASLFKLSLMPGDCSYKSTWIILYAWKGTYGLNKTPDAIKDIKTDIQDNPGPLVSDLFAISVEVGEGDPCDRKDLRFIDELDNMDVPENGGSLL
ncbi:hypothetical protein TURU_144206 [Turdus rufiventris]|nr:hypothetical protein TURU_144206 [Turdus rufiventris]